METGRFTSDKEFKTWCNIHHFCSAAVELMREIRSALPSRQVQGFENVRGIYPSLKMAVGIQFESHTVELPKVFEFEHQVRYREYYDQPPKIPFKYFDKSTNRNAGHLGTPDYFQFSEHPGWVECKNEGELVKLQKKTPEMYEQQPDKSWRCPPGEAYAMKYGLSYKIHSSKSTDWVLYENLKFLEDYCDGPAVVVPEPVTKAALDLVKKRPGITAAELLRANAGITPDFLHFLIERFQIYTDLSGVFLHEQHRVKLYRNHRIAKVHALAAKPTSGGWDDELLIEPALGTVFTFDSVRYEIIHFGSTSLKLRVVDGDAVTDWPLKDFESRLMREQLKPCGLVESP